MMPSLRRPRSSVARLLASGFALLAALALVVAPAIAGARVCVGDCAGCAAAVPGAGCECGRPAPDGPTVATPCGCPALTAGPTVALCLAAEPDRPPGVSGATADDVPGAAPARAHFFAPRAIDRAPPPRRALSTVVLRL